ncbi:hypothetical protein BJ508DRAFT_375458 [Ascobolus immersus RN42]|uniref:C2H2-type domain-containing protein n=1 Tax=Ascobolus immersus RN42 TaxID=1160509 RepID=A0A3N4IEP7_ASCIM|nr:hypothetical protein BJ508DRAFT_375458 [Ascobolus immersus RN42]
MVSFLIHTTPLAGGLILRIYLAVFATFAVTIALVSHILLFVDRHLRFFNNLFPRFLKLIDRKSDESCLEDLKDSEEKKLFEEPQPASSQLGPSFDNTTTTNVSGSRASSNEAVSTVQADKQSKAREIRQGLAGQASVAVQNPVSSPPTSTLSFSNPQSDTTSPSATTAASAATESTRMTVECSACGKSCANLLALEAHHHSGAHANEFYCFLCDTFFTNEVETSSHNIEKHNSISIVCDGCNCVFLKDFTYNKHHEACNPPEEQHNCFEYGCGFTGSKADVNRHWDKVHRAEAEAAEAYFNMRKAEKAAEMKKNLSGYSHPELIIGNIENKHRAEQKMTAPPAPKPITAALGMVDKRPSLPSRLLPKPTGKDCESEQQYCRPFSFPLDEPTIKTSMVEKPKAPASRVASESKPFVMPPRPPTPPPKYGPGSKSRPLSNVEMKAPNDESSRPRTVRHNHAPSTMAPAVTEYTPPVRGPGPSQSKRPSARKPFCCLCTKEYEDWPAFDEHWVEKHPDVERNPGVPADHVPLVNGRHAFDRPDRSGPPGRMQSNLPGTRQFGPQGRQRYDLSGPGRYPNQNGAATGGRGATDKKEVHLADQVKELLRQKALKLSQEAAMAKLKERMQNSNGKLPDRQQKAQESAPATPTKAPAAKDKPLTEGHAVATLEVPQDELRKALSIPKTMKAEVVLRELPGYGTKAVKKDTMEDIKKKVQAGEPLPMHLAIKLAAERVRKRTEAEQEYIPNLREQWRFFQGRPRRINWEEDEDVYVTEEVAEANGLPAPSRHRNIGNNENVGPNASSEQGLGAWGGYDGSVDVARLEADSARFGAWGTYDGSADVARLEAQPEPAQQAFDGYAHPQVDAVHNPFAGYGSDFLAQLNAQNVDSARQMTTGTPSVTGSVAPSVSAASAASTSTVVIPPILTGAAGKSMFVALPEEPRMRTQPVDGEATAPAAAKPKSTMLFGRRR